jgi:hypothetical protein
MKNSIFLVVIFTKPLDASHFTALWGGLVFVIPMAWFKGEPVFYLVYFYPFTFLLHFLHTHLSYLASPIILACIWMIMHVLVLG